MRPKPNAADRLLVLTLALERSLVDRDWTLAEQLMNERSLALDEANADSLLDKLKLQEAARVEQRCLSMLQSAKRGILDQISESFQARRMSVAYGSSVPSSGFDGGH